MLIWICGKSHAHHVHDPPQEVSAGPPRPAAGNNRRRRSSNSGVGAFISYMFVSPRAQMDPVPAQVEVDGTASVQGDGVSDIEIYV